MKVALSSGGQNQKLESVMSRPLKDQAFATPDKVAELVQKVGHNPFVIVFTLFIHWTADHSIPKGFFIYSGSSL